MNLAISQYLFKYMFFLSFTQIHAGLFINIYYIILQCIHLYNILLHLIYIIHLIYIFLILYCIEIYNA